MTRPGPARPVSGEQVELRRGPLRARVGQVAAVLRGFWHGSAALTENWPDDVVTPMGAGMVLMPWPNRVAGGRWSADGAAQQLDLTEPKRGNAIHGLLRNTGYQIEARAEISVTHAATVYPQHGYPFTLDTTVTHALSHTGLTVTHTVTNAGAGTAPFGVGAHPYLRVGDTPVEQLTLTLAARTRAEVDEASIPTRLIPVSGQLGGLPDGVLVGSLGVFDGAFTDLAVTDGRVHHHVTAPDGRGVTLWADEAFGWAQVYTPDDFPGPGLPDRRTALAVEPMTCAADALNNGWGLAHLEPGDTWTGSWGLTPVGF